LPATNTYNSRGREWKYLGSHTFLVLLWIKKKHFGLIFVSGITEGVISSSLNCASEVRPCYPSIPHEGIQTDRQTDKKKCTLTSMILKITHF